MNKLKDISRKIIKSRITAVIIFVLTAILFFFAVKIYLDKDYRTNHVEINGEWYDIHISELDLSHSDIESVKPLERLSDVKFLDLRHTPLTASQVLSLIKDFPECEILWSVPLGSALVDSDTREVNLSELSVTDIAPLEHLTELEYIDARGYDYDIVSQLFASYEKCRIDWDIRIGDVQYPPSTQTLGIKNASSEDLANLLLFDTLSKVDIFGCRDYEALMKVMEKFPDCEFSWTTSIGSFTVSDKDTELNFNRTEITDIAALDEDFKALSYLPNLTYIDMCGCGVPSEQMGKWRDAYPHCKFVWEITFGSEVKSWTVRTDIQVFSSLLRPFDKIGDQETYKELFLYCTDLVALDLGHNRITDISYITNLKKLQVVILADNPIADLSPLSELHDLVYIEFFLTEVSDLSPLKNLKNLVHLDVSNTNVRDISPLYECTWLDHLIVIQSGFEISGHLVDQMNASSPKTQVVWHTDEFGKRETNIRNHIKQFFKKYKQIDKYITWDNVIYK